MKRCALISVLTLFLCGCALIHQTGEVVEEVGTALEHSGNKRSDNIVGKTAKVGGKVYTFVGRAIQKVSGKGRRGELGKTNSQKALNATKETTWAAVKGFNTALDELDEGGQRVLSAQQALNSKGYPTGRPDGVLGPKTSAAIKQFQKDNQLSESGQLDEKTRAQLGITH